MYINEGLNVYVLSNLVNNVRQAKKLAENYKNTSDPIMKSAIKKNYGKITLAINRDYPNYVKEFNEKKLPPLSGRASTALGGNKPWPIETRLDVDRMLKLAPYLRASKITEYGLMMVAVGTNGTTTWNATHSWDAVWETVRNDLLMIAVGGVVTGLIVTLIFYSLTSIDAPTIVIAVSSMVGAAIGDFFLG